MKTIIFFLTLTLFCSIWSPTAYSASNPVTAMVIFAEINGNGDLIIELDQKIDETGCEVNQLIVLAEHPQIDRWLSIAINAIVHQKQINTRTKGCSDGKPTLVQTKSVWFKIVR